jgi:3'-phosphoadenosine 5'-phosphosulfate sulfotransferase (PAPS reductase)/FAD synthetase
MKKKSAHKYFKETNMYPIIATMTEESGVREKVWLKHGCNAFNSNNPKSTPMSFWTEQDVLKYIKMMNIPIASVYGDIKSEIRGGKNTII